MALEVLNGKPASIGSDLFMLGKTVFFFMTGSNMILKDDRIPKTLFKVPTAFMNYS